MTERLTPAEVSFLHREQPTVPQHVGTLAVFDGSADLDYDRLVSLVEERIGRVPRFRQRVLTVPGHLANPVWADDPTFDVTYHVRRSSVPRPGTDVQLLEFCARIQSRVLDHDHPLWEIYLIEGLADDRVALMSKTHHAMVDGIAALDIAQVILDAAPGRPTPVETIWMPRAEPTGAELVLDALAEAAARPTVLLETARIGVRDMCEAVARVGSVGAGVVSSAAALVRRPSASPLAAEPGERRRMAIARTRLDDYRQVRSVHGGAVNDVVLATVAGALRGWLLFRDQPTPAGATVRALVPVSVDDETGSLVDPVAVELPIGEPDPVLRLARIGYAMSTHKSSRRPIAAEMLVALGGFGPPALHALGARVADELTRRMFQLVVTNVPGPQRPLYAAGAQMTEMFPLPPLGAGRAVAIGVTSYDGGVYFGINGDWDAMPDVGVFAVLLEESLAELVAASPLRDRTPRAGRPSGRPLGGQGPAAGAASSPAAATVRGRS